LASIIKIGVDDKQIYRSVLRALTTGNLFKKLEGDLRLIAVIMDECSKIPMSLREMELEEVFEKSEIVIVDALEHMIAQKKLPEYLDFHPRDLVTIAQAFAFVFMGSDNFYASINKTATKFKSIFDSESLILLA